MTEKIKISSTGWLFMAIGVVLQVIAYVITGSALLSFASGLLGVFSVVLCSERKTISYLFGFAQIGTYVVLAAHQHFYGELLENVFYFVTMIAGVIMWLKHSDRGVVESKKLTPVGWVAWLGTMAIGIAAVWYRLVQTNDTQPFMDAITTVPAFIAQILMITRFREQWFFWLIIDVGSIFMWINAGDWNMAMQFVFWTANCIYGWIKWKD